MTSNELTAAFEEHDGLYLEFDRVEVKRSNRPDLHAFLLLDSLLPANRDIVSAAEHDEIFLDVDMEKLAEVITEEQVKELIECGVMHNSDHDCLSMFA